MGYTCKHESKLLYPKPDNWIKRLFKNIYFKYHDLLEEFKKAKDEKFLDECFESDSNIIKYALMEFEYAGWMNSECEFTDEYQKEMCIGILKVLQEFSKCGHSGCSASYAISVLEKLIKFEPLTFLKGTDDEWIELDEEMMGRKTFQNKRCTSIFRDENGFTYDVNGRYFTENGNKDCAFSAGNASCTFIKFPCISPKSEYIHLDGELTEEMRIQYYEKELEKWKKTLNK